VGGTGDDRWMRDGRRQTDMMERDPVLMLSPISTRGTILVLMRVWNRYKCVFP
jgi:hypothetical protein